MSRFLSLSFSVVVISIFSNNEYGDLACWAIIEYFKHPELNH